ncbi:lasso RiPP family leader peptide-containing protein [Amycolatopsis sp. NPDC054798]
MKAYEPPTMTLVGEFHSLTNGARGCRWEWIGDCGWC